MYDQNNRVLVFGGYCIDMVLRASITLKLPVILILYNLYYLIIYKKA